MKNWKRKRLRLASDLIGENMLVLQSRDFEENTSVPRFLLKFTENVTYEGFLCWVKHTITSLSKN